MSCHQKTTMALTYPPHNLTVGCGDNLPITSGRTDGKTSFKSDGQPS